MKRFVLLLLALAACSEPLAPRRISATYVLQSISGTPIPAVIAEGGGQRYEILADTLVFDARGIVTRSRTERWISTNPVPRDTTFHLVFTRPYEILGTQLIIGERITCGPAANCAGWEEGAIVGSTLWVAAAHSAGTPVLAYLRAG